MSFCRVAGYFFGKYFRPKAVAPGESGPLAHTHYQRRFFWLASAEKERERERRRKREPKGAESAS